MQPSACIIVGPFSINCKKQSMRRGQHHLSRCWINAGEGREQSRGLAQGGTALDGLRYEVAIKCEQTGSDHQSWPASGQSASCGLSHPGNGVVVATSLPSLVESNMPFCVATTNYSDRRKIVSSRNWPMTSC